ncbi:TetR/AcrR family transcriptional regulator [Nocardioides sp. MH1]|uniref:TetR/AcrR family transcriptional regulator n=1 Tax=Nocardioides sp. MH1 TaxID=3242490 RepID=UPI0035208F56
MVTPLRESYRAHLRQRVLEAAYVETVEKGWDKVRVGHIATSIGAPRAMIYKEFGDKQGLGEALVLHEAERFLAGIKNVLTEFPVDAAGGIQASVRYTLAEAEKSPLLRAVLVSHRDSALDSGTFDTPSGMLPLITTSKRLLDVASDTLATWLHGQFPELDSVDVQDATDALVRLAVSHLALPGADAETTGRRISEVAFRYLGLLRTDGGGGEPAARLVR